MSFDYAQRATQLLAKATDGPWEVDDEEENNYAVKRVGTAWSDGFAYVNNADDAALIAEAPALLRGLLEENARLRKENPNAMTDAELHLLRQARDILNRL